MVTPSIDAVPLTHMQKFKEGGVSKNTMHFDRMEDMMTMCLSTFVHDYVHDYNLGSMHARVIKGNILRKNPDEPSLFEKLGINIENPIFKIMAYPVGGHRDVSMYNDEQFEDVETDDTNKRKFYDYLNGNERAIQTQTSLVGGDAFVKPEDIVKPEELNKDEFVSSDSFEKEKQLNKDEFEKTEDLVNDVVKPIYFNDVKESITIPSVVGGIDISELTNKFENDADFLDFFSSLKLYVVTYLGYNVGSNSDKNGAIFDGIRGSLKYIIDDLTATNTILFDDIFVLFFSAFEVVSKNNKRNLGAFDLLNSPELLYQFIVFYIMYISVSDYKTVINEFVNVSSMTGGDGEMDEEEPMSSVSPDSSPLLPTADREVIPISEQVFITHNNLLTTVARGMFIKLGIWKKLFFPNVPAEEIKAENYVFDADHLNAITYDKLVELFPIDPENGGHKNNELLILETLILKRLLVEMSPSKTLAFGQKIDDDLKNYMDAFYLQNYSFGNTTGDVMLDSLVIDNPSFDGLNREALEREAELLFGADDDADENEFDFEGSPMDSSMKMEGGGLCPSKPVPGSPPCIEPSETVPANLPSIPSSDLDANLPSIPSDNLDANLDANLPLSFNPSVNLEENIENTKDETVLPDTSDTSESISIVEQPKAPPVPVLFKKLKKMYQNNIAVIQQLEESKIAPIDADGITVDNLFSLLKLNQTLMNRKGSKLSITAPKYKFVINNASNVGSNINGTRMFVPRSYLDSIRQCLETIKEKTFDNEVLDSNKLTNYKSEIETTLASMRATLKKDFQTKLRELNAKKRNKMISMKEYNELLKLRYDQKVFERTEIVPVENTAFLLDILTNNPDFFDDFDKNYAMWFRDSQPIFGLYRSLQRGIFCPTSSMMDAMDNCSLKYNTTEPKEVGTSYSEILYNGPDGTISFGGVVLNYNDKVNGSEQLTSKIYYTLDCQTGANASPDKMIINTMGIKVSESNDLKARVAYQGVINMIKTIYDTTETVSEGLAGVDYIKEMWKTMQYQHDYGAFNMLLSATALKTMGDYLQECQACFKWGGYVDNVSEFPEELKRTREFKRVKNKLIYRSVSKADSIIPYDEHSGDGLRLGIQGDRPSGFRSIYMLLNGEGDVNDQAITGYVFTSSTQNPSRTLLVARNSKNMRDPNSNGLKGQVIYVTRELQVPNRNDLLRSLEYLNVKEKNRKVFGDVVVPEITDSTISGSKEVIGKLLENPLSRIVPMKNNAYDKWLDYSDSTFEPVPPKVEVETEKTDAEEAREQKRNKMKLKAMESASDSSISNSSTSNSLNKPSTKLMKEDRTMKSVKRKEEKAMLEKDVRDARIKINSIRNDLSEKQKMAKAVPKVPFSFLQDPENQSKIEALQIPEHIYKIIYDEAEENDRISKLADERLRLEREEKERKKQEEARLKAQRLEYESSPEGMAELQAKALAKQEEAERFAMQKEEEKTLMQLAVSKKEKEREELQTEINGLMVEMLAFPKKIKDMTPEQVSQKKEIEGKLKVLRERMNAVRRGGSRNIHNNFSNNHKFTKRRIKNRNKLTKRERRRKHRVPRWTRKILKEF